MSTSLDRALLRGPPFRTTRRMWGVVYDIERSGRTLTWWLLATAVASASCIGVYVYAIAYPTVFNVSDTQIGLVEGADLIYSLVNIVTAVLTLRWIYQANSNAHRLVDGLSISPLWSVAWFFVPIAFMWKPFVGVRDTWAASADPDKWTTVRTPIVLVAWWILWTTSYVLDWVSFKLTWNVYGEEVASYLPIDIGANAAEIGATILLMRVIPTLSRMQTNTMMRHTFA